MRRLLILVAIWIATFCPSSAEPARAAAIKGRVVDSTGEPVRDAQVRLWQKSRPVGGRVPNLPVLFDGAEILHTDESGQFATPDVFDTPMPVRVVAQAEGMLAGRSQWIAPKQEVNEIGDLVLVRLNGLVGQVVDGQGNPVAGATVFNGDGHDRVETKSGSNGKFFLDRVPENAPFLFAEKAGCRLTGTLLGAKKSIELQMARSDEPIEPLRSREALATDEERLALARSVLDPYLDAVTRRGNDSDKGRALETLAGIDPLAAFESLDRVGFTGKASKEDCRARIVLHWMARKPNEGWDEIRSAIESSENNDWAASCLLRGAAYFIPQTDAERRRDWIDQGLVRARAGRDATSRAIFQAWGAEALWRAGDRERAAAVAREAEAMAKELPQAARSDSAFLRLARALAPIDLPDALGWLDRVKNDFQFAQEGAFIALDFAAKDPSKADEIWNHLGDRPSQDRAFLKGRDRNAPDFCFRLATQDTERARRIAAAVEDPLWRLQARGGLARAANAAAAKALREAIADPAVPQIAPAESPLGIAETAASALARLLPEAERVDPVAARELLWRAISLRPAQPTVAFLDDEILGADLELAQMMARFEPSIARALLARAVRQLPQLASSASPTASMPMRVVVASAFIDPRWAIELLDSLPEPPDTSYRQPKHKARLSLVSVLRLTGSDFWQRAGFWEPEEP